MTHDDPQETVRDWRTGLNRSSSTEMRHLAESFGSIKWWALEPHPELILNQSDDWTKHMVLGKSATGDLVMAYLPDNDSIELDLSTLARSVSGRWTNPKSGESEPAVVAMTTRSARFVRPQG